MTIRVLDTSGEQTSLMETGPSISVIRTYRGLDIAEFPMGVNLYRTSVMSVANAAWVTVPFTTILFPDATYNTPVMFVKAVDATVVNILETGWYLLYASIGFAAVGGADIVERYRFLTGTGGALAGKQRTIPAAYTYQISGALAYYLGAGSTISLQVSHSNGSAINLQSGITNSGLGITLISH